MDGKTGCSNVTHVLLALVLATSVVLIGPGCTAENASRVNIRTAQKKCSEPDELIAFARLAGSFWQIWTMHPDGSNVRQLTTSQCDKRHPAPVDNGERLVFRTHNNELFLVDLDGQNETQIMPEFSSTYNHCYSPARGEIFFVSYGYRPSDQSEICKCSFHGQGRTFLTDDRSIKYHLSVSPDGTRLAFIKVDEGPSLECQNLWIMNTDNTEPRKLTSGKAIRACPSFSHDGKMLAFSSNHENGDFDVFWIRMSGRPVHRVTRHPAFDSSPTFSPDGRHLAFVSSRSGSKQIWIAARDGGNAMQITSDPAESVDPSWFRHSKGR